MFFFDKFYYGTGARYNSSFAIVFALNLLIISVIFFGVGLGLKFLVFMMKKYCITDTKPHVAPGEVVVRDGPQSPTVRRGKKCPTHKFLRVISCMLDVLGTILVLATVFMLGLIPSGFYGLHRMPLYGAVLSTFGFMLLSMSLFIIWKALKKKEKLDDEAQRPHTTFRYRMKMAILRQKGLFALLTVIAIFYTVFFPFALRDTCICLFSNKYGINVMSGTAVLTTRMMRGVTLPKTCNPGAPCHVYATLPSNTSTSVFINAHTHFDVQNLVVEYDLLTAYEASGTLTRSAVASSYPLDIEDKGRRTVHTTLLTGLTPETEYFYRFSYNGQTYDGLKYKTLPLNGSNSSTLYFFYLPQHYRSDPTTGQDLLEVPNPYERRTFFYHLIGKTIQVSLDSGYVASYPSQVQWMNKILPNYPTLNKFGNYHVPMYPACNDFEDTPESHIQIAQDNFVPAFQQYRFKALFENHVHLFKKTFPLIDGKRDDVNGIRYYGDGNWGITPNDCLSSGGLANDTHIIDRASADRHVWIIDLNATSFQIYPVNINGQVFVPPDAGNLDL